MRWFEGSIPAAIEETKAARKLLAVFLVDATEDSRLMTSVLDSAPVEAALTPDNAVALKLESGTDAFAQFSVFYPVLILPSVYFIGDNGIPLEVVGGHQDVDAFLQRANNAFALFNGQTTTTTPEIAAPEATAASDVTTTTTVSAEDSITPVAAASAPTASADPDVAAGAASSSTDAASSFADAASSSTDASAPLGDRVLTAKEKIEAQNRERIDRENEETKKRELERRKLGQVRACVRE